MPSAAANIQSLSGVPNKTDTNMWTRQNYTHFYAQLVT